MNVNVVFMLCVTALGAVVEANPASPLIVGGVNAKAGEIPWIASLLAAPWADTHFCGGSILDKRTILTAAHCVEDLDAKNDRLRVRLGSLLRDKGGRVYNVSKIIIHASYDSATTNNDIAILKMASDMIVSGTIDGIPVSPVQLPPTVELTTGTIVRVAGWGYYNAGGGPLSDNLKWVDVPIVSRSVCNTGYGGVTNQMICAGEPGEDSCSGDSGGPLTKGNVIYGIVSWGAFPCADPKLPGVYTNVVNLLNWINTNKV